MVKDASANKITVIVAILGFLATIIAATIGAVSNNNSQKLLQQIESTKIAIEMSKAAVEIIATQGGATQNVMETAINVPTQPPYPTYTPYPTITSIPSTATSIPTPTSDPRLFWDDFETGVKPDWKILSGRCNMVNGMLKCPTVPARFEVGSNDWTNYRVEFDTGEYWKFHEGVIVMVKLANNGSHLSLHLPPCGTASWTYTNSNGKEEGVATTTGGVCEHGPFHIIIECNNDIYTTMINGKVISTFQETRTPEGKIGFYTDIDNIEIWFDNISVSIVN